MTSQVNHRTVKKCRNLATLPMADNICEEDETSESNSSAGVQISHLSKFSCKPSEVTSGTWTRPLPIGKPKGEYWNCFFFAAQMIWYELRHIKYLFAYTTVMSLPLLLHFLLRVTSELTSQGSFLGHRRFSSIAFDQIELDSPERHHCAGTELPNRRICNLITLSQSMTWGGVTWPWPRSQAWLWPLSNKKYIIRRDFKRGLRWCFGLLT